MRKFFQDHLNQDSSKRLIAIVFSAAVLLLIFAYASHAHYEFTLGAMLGFIGGLLGITAFEKTIKHNNTNPNNPNEPPKI